MFSGIIALLLPVVLAVASPLVARSDVTALEAAFDGMAKTVLAIQESCKAFSESVDLTHATAVGNAAKTLDSDAIPFVPKNVTERRCAPLSRTLPSLLSILEGIVALKDDFNTICVVSIVCIIVNDLAADNCELMNNLIAATPAFYKTCANDLNDKLVAEATKVQVTFC
ncbi:uncharacterized protein BT62DRAFT_996038 [Guyanagaster necrorhizus]|uniref:Uncharacterized protein n=1 Tax=Guyanagaster necrorhizus TaxID=856835 RepID=A0A9P8AR45_9AGAR|nr:uncharacterized protein BT62DRAFT_996038 [Guyanagaster necrorhizus MCA 3950]KAG7443497.1 hypothetical protein BT62DRAFT_996038 [Guyanagaster necrorhizus MCA 3950]